MSLRKELDCLVVGGGAFGTALATVLMDTGKRVLLWVRREDLAVDPVLPHATSYQLRVLAAEINDGNSARGHGETSPDQVQHLCQAAQTRAQPEARPPCDGNNQQR